MRDVLTRLGPLGFGAAQFGNLNVETDDQTCHAAVEAAWGAGIRYFDTAPHYGLGLSERRLGAALADRPRDQFVVSTKAGRLLEPNPDYRRGDLDDQGFRVPATSRRRWDFSRDGILRSLESSLDRLGLDRVDIVYLHDPDEHWESASTTGVSALIELRDEGVIGAVGVGMNQSAIPARFVAECDIDVVMLAGRYTLLDQSALDDLLPLALDRDVAIVAAGVYNSGILSSVHVSDAAAYDYGQAPAELIEHARLIAKHAEAIDVTLPEAAVRFPFTHPAVRTVVLGMRTARHVASGAQRMHASVPDALWTDLANSSLIDPRCASTAASPFQGADS
ncbi:aldo/keto reductase [Microbacterium rhizosphaerae]|uniref:Aldo/keto reductase n=1 Tax=Microbacterium rhizosphaerae TaxID=1678237 RepID=A0ABZ0SJ67_9MICO|nr:aldo/keto reductase [Microbacterium rhizosphaerae]WPR89123.1 aldo/keto reductase [Microbacterium rhizosphaerae]